MNKRFVFTALAGILVLSIVAVFMANTVTTVSAKEILDRAYEAQSTQETGEWISHRRIETYHNLCARPDNTAIATVMDSYFDPQTGYFRTTVMDAEGGSVLEVSAFDGTYIYTGHRSVETKSDIPEQGPKPKHVVCDGQPWGDTSELLTVYRGAQNNVASADLSKNEDVQAYEEMFEQMRNDQNTELLGEQTWLDGRSVYVLRSWQPVKAIVDGITELPMGWVMSYFDTESYKLVESRATIERDGQEILAYSYRVLADEIIPIGSYQHWDLSDLNGITIVDDPDGQHADYLPESISEEQLASSTESAYLLKNIPDGFTLEITASPNQPTDQSLIYVASYRTEAGDYFVIQSIGSKEVKWMAENSDESYTTANRLVLRFMADIKDRSDKQFTSAVFETPEGEAFIINSTLSREQVKALAEDLVLVSK